MHNDLHSESGVFLLLS